MVLGLIGGIIGVLIGLAGGIFGSYMSIKNTATADERSFMIKLVAVFWTIALFVLSLLFLSAIRVLPAYFYWIAWGFFIFLLGPFIWWGNKRLAFYRNEESSKT